MSKRKHKERKKEGERLDHVAACEKEVQRWVERLCLEVAVEESVLAQAVSQCT